MPIKTLSHSSMSLYRECPQRFKFRYVDGIREEPKHYFSFGQSVHKALEFFYRSQLIAPSLAEVSSYYKTNWIQGGYKSHEQEEQYYEDGLKIVAAFHKKHITDWKPPMATEYDFSVAVDGVTLRGKIDRVDKLPDGTIHVIDYKTGKVFAPSKVLEDAQMTLYQLACEASFASRVSRLTLYHLPTLTPMTSPRHEDRLVRELRRGILSVKTAIDNEIFDPKPEEWKCSRCDYKKICPAWSEGSAAAVPTVAKRQQSAYAPFSQEATQTAVVEKRGPAELSVQLDELIQKTEDLTRALRALKETAG